MTTLTIHAGGEVRLEKEILRHLGVSAGGTITLNLLPGGRAELVPSTQKASEDTALSFKDLHGFLAGKTNGRKLTIEELNEAIAEAGAAAGNVRS